MCLSAAHAVVPGGQYQILLPSGKRMRGVGKGSNIRTDAALIMLTRPGNDLPYVPMGDSSSLVTDQPVLGLSFPGGQKAGSEPVDPLRSPCGHQSQQWHVAINGSDGAWRFWRPSV